LGKPAPLGHGSEEGGSAFGGSATEPPCLQHRLQPMSGRIGKKEDAG